MTGAPLKEYHNENPPMSLEQVSIAAEQKLEFSDKLSPLYRENTILDIYLNKGKEICIYLFQYQYNILKIVPAEEVAEENVLCDYFLPHH